MVPDALAAAVAGAPCVPGAAGGGPVPPPPDAAAGVTMPAALRKLRLSSSVVIVFPPTWVALSLCLPDLRLSRAASGDRSRTLPSTLVADRPSRSGSRGHSQALPTPC